MQKLDEHTIMMISHSNIEYIDINRKLQQLNNNNGTAVGGSTAIMSIYEKSSLEIQRNEYNFIYAYYITIFNRFNTTSFNRWNKRL